MSRAPLPGFHTSFHFLIAPSRWRWEFLRRNPHVMKLVAYLDAVRPIAEQVYARFGASDASPGAAH
jgi:hypothetical protein